MSSHFVDSLMATQLGRQHNLEAPGMPSEPRWMGMSHLDRQAFPLCFFSLSFFFPFFVCVCMHLVTQSCPALCEPMDCACQALLSVGIQYSP